MRKPAILVRDPELVHKVFVTDFYSFRNNDVDSNITDDPMSRNAFVLQDEEWKRTRALITPAFSSGKIKSMYPQMIEIAKEFNIYLKKHPEEIHVKDAMSRFMTEVVAKCAFGIEGNSFKEEKPQMHSVGKSIFAPSKKQSFMFMIIFFLPVLNKIFKFRIVPSNVSEFFNSVLKDIIVYRQNNNVDRNDLVNYLIELKRKSLEVEKGNVQSDLIKRPYTDEDVLAGCVMFFVEAFETSSLLMSHILYQLAMNKDVQDRLRAEINEEMKKGDISYERLHEMTLVNAVLLETNRMMPVAHFHFKRCTEDYEFDLGNGKKVPVKKGMSVVLPSYGIHTDPLYWEDPLTFNPDRFPSNEEGQQAKAKGIYMPFGDGPRMCIGVRLSSTIIKACLVYVLSKFEVVPSSKTPKKIELDPEYFMTTHKGGIYLKFVEKS
ncbi:UNVERIFIED_CONTAM: hypothetical protein PYX00_009337 [Menopon gallinae]